ncbi:MAG TPA: YlxR family protein [Candidatus Limnocylindrales bacterium]
MTAGAICRVPNRTCVVCRTSRQKRELRRLVRTPDGHVVMDPTGRLNGRGAYVCMDGSCLTTALEKGALARALSTPIPAALREALAKQELTTNRGELHGQE